MSRVRRIILGTARVALRPVGSVMAVQTAATDVVLTFDDGPDPFSTPRVLEVLGKHAALATFFVLTCRTERHPDTLEQIVAAGHEVGLHGPDHRRLTELPAREVFTRTLAAKQLLESRVGAEIRWFRPPYGAQSPATWLAIRRAGLQPVFWGPSLWDWKDVDEKDRRARALEGVRPGSIVLGHDALAGPDEGEPNPVPCHLDRAAWLDTVLTEYRLRGLRPTSLGDALRRGSPVVRGQFDRG